MTFIHVLHGCLSIYPESSEIRRRLLVDSFGWLVGAICPPGLAQVTQRAQVRSNHP